MRVLVVHKRGQITTIVKDHVERLAIREEDGLLKAPHVLVIRLSCRGRGLGRGLKMVGGVNGGGGGGS